MEISNYDNFTDTENSSEQSLTDCSYQPMINHPGNSANGKDLGHSDSKQCNWNRFPEHPTVSPESLESIPEIATNSSMETVEQRRVETPHHDKGDEERETAESYNTNTTISHPYPGSTDDTDYPDISSTDDIPDINYADGINHEPRFCHSHQVSGPTEDEIRTQSRATHQFIFAHIKEKHEEVEEPTEGEEKDRIDEKLTDNDGITLDDVPKVAGPRQKKPGKRRRSENPGSMKNKDVSNDCQVNGELDDDPHLKVTYTPGKKGGSYGLPVGAKLVVPEGLFGKKDSITCQVAPPAQRWRHCPVLTTYEHMTSEIFVLTSTLQTLKKNIIVQIPFYQIDPEHNELNVKGKWKDENEWVNVGFLKKEDSSTPCVELEIDRLGIFVVTFTPKRELFDVTPQGCLYNAHISRYISIRFPKKAADKSFQCAIQITPISPDKLELAKDFYPTELCDLVQTTEFIDLIPSIPCNFRRAATVKLPLPGGVEVEDESSNTIGVFQKTEKGWELVESKYKYTRTTVTFDVKSLSRFCIVQTKPDRAKRVLAAVPIVEGRSDKEKGEVIAFLNIQEKLWFVVLECFPQSKTETRIKEMKDRGFKHIGKQILRREEVVENKGFRRSQPKQNKVKEIQGFELFDGMKWTMEVVEDIKVSFDSDYMENKDFQYFRHLPDSCRKFIIEPKNNDEKAISGAINLIPLNMEGDARMKEASTFTLKIDIDEEAVKAYFRPEFVPEEPEPVKEKPNLDLLMMNTVKEEKPLIPTIPKFKPLPATVMERLMKTSRKPIIVEKESKTISGKSLRTLSRLVPEGLTLAVHLDLPDSTITGLGFDAISNGLSMADVTYKILLYWKRQMKDKKDGAVDRLSTALRDMGRGEVATVVNQCHKDSKELTLDSFEVMNQS
ncbi:uncharacterized protein LOC132548173 [Ylistrum balloti]|uniref:uncharacterized protein LOC132548173 n=1 Tax=Ylistrum balloti TaxID=509963 RepID=UPI002905CC4F|nr:uncharacterized protein LOC132548173 [Ylistrum balloti]